MQFRGFNVATTHDGLKVLQAARLVEFYEMCKGLDFARNFQFPVLEQVRLASHFLSGMYESSVEGTVNPAL
jgi:hypothetical protein